VRHLDPSAAEEAEGLPLLIERDLDVAGVEPQPALDLGDLAKPLGLKRRDECTQAEGERQA
jgi:hypothetical protein